MNADTDKPHCPHCKRHPVLILKNSDLGVLSFAKPLTLNCPRCRYSYGDSSKETTLVERKP